MQGDFVFLDTVFGCDNPKYYPSPGRGIELAHAIFRSLHLCKTLFLWEALQEASGIASLSYVFEDWKPHI